MTVGSSRLRALILFLIAADVCILANIPVLRQILGFTLLTLLPGFLLLLVGRMTNLEPLKRMVFLLGLSISFLLFVPLLMNFAYPALGIARPLSELPLTATFSLLLGGLAVLAYRTGALDFRIPTGQIEAIRGTILSPPALGSALIVVLGIFGGFFVRFNSSTFVLLLSTLSVVIVIVVIAANRRASERFYPLYVFCIALALQYGHTLASANLFGSDVQLELYLADVVQSLGYWNPNLIASNQYAMLSVTLLPNVYSLVLNVDLVSVYKFIYPLIFAFVPVGLYALYKSQTSSRVAILSAVFFMSFFAFFTAMLWLPRQQIGELFLVALALLLTSTEQRNPRTTGLTVLFIVSLVVSHYATSYIFLLFVFLLWLVPTIVGALRRRENEDVGVTWPLVALTFAFNFLWYIYISLSQPFASLITLSQDAYKNFGGDLFNTEVDPNVAKALGGGLINPSTLHLIGQYWQIGTQVLVVIGLAYAVWQRKKLKINDGFLLLAVVSLALLLVVIVDPRFGVALQSYRYYALALIFLAPFPLIAAQAGADAVSGWSNRIRRHATALGSVLFITILVPYFLFNGGALFEVLEYPANYLPVPLPGQQGHVDVSAPAASYLVGPPTSRQDISAARWFGGTRDAALSVYSDSFSQSGLIGYGSISPSSLFAFKAYTPNGPFDHAYRFFGRQNVKGNVTLEDARGNSISDQAISSLPGLTAGNKIYDNGQSEFYYSK